MTTKKEKEILKKALGCDWAHLEWYLRNNKSYRIYSKSAIKNEWKDWYDSNGFDEEEVAEYRKNINLMIAGKPNTLEGSTWVRVPKGKFTYFVEIEE